MTWRFDWQRYSERIASLEAATSAALSAFRLSSDNPYGTAGRLTTEWRALAKDLEEFRRANESAIPAPAHTQLLSLAGEALLQDGSISSIEGLAAYLAIFAAFRSRFVFQLADTQELAVSATERAFVHLQQLIVVDEALRQRWGAAFADGETKCETLGAAHLMLHGVWSFKAHTAGARTDLVLQETSLDLSLVERAANVLVLTEWKKVVKADEATSIAESARRQAKLYGTGVLSAVELRRQRYIVLVSKDRLPPIPDEHDGDIVYRHVNVAIAPSTPSAAT